jgi:hypothetical protein
MNTCEMQQDQTIGEAYFPIAPPQLYLEKKHVGNIAHACRGANVHDTQFQICRASIHACM